MGVRHLMDILEDSSFQGVLDLPGKDLRSSKPGGGSKKPILRGTCASLQTCWVF